MGMVSLTNCTKNEVLTPGTESVGFTACIEDVDTKTALNGLNVYWVKGDEICIQVSRNHTENASAPKASYPSTYGVYRLADDAAILRKESLLIVLARRPLRAMRSSSPSIRQGIVSLMPRTAISMWIFRLPSITKM